MNNNRITHVCPKIPDDETSIYLMDGQWNVHDQFQDAGIVITFCRFCWEKLLIPTDRPGLVKEPDFKYLVETCETYLDNLVKNGYADEDDREYIYEAAMTALYGGKVFEFINSPRGK